MIHGFIKILTACLLFIVLGLSGAACHHRQGRPVRYPTAIVWQSYEDGLARAKAERKPIMLIFGADWCGPCHILARKVLADPRVIARAKDFVAIHVNADQREDLQEKYRAKPFPYILFLNPDGEVLDRVRVPWECSQGKYAVGNAVELLHGMEAARKLVLNPAAPSDDFFKLTPAEEALVCAVDKSTDPCVACINAHCCAESVSCAYHADACVCAKPPSGPEYQALDACARKHCPQCTAKN